MAFHVIASKGSAMSATHRIGILLLVAFAFILGSFWQFAGAQGEKAKGTVQKWEHKHVTTFKDVETLGDEGWELVALEPEMPYVMRDFKSSTHRSFFLKRPKP
jgi:hypothetical protein